MTEEEKRKIGGKIHNILNLTVARKLTMNEYKKVIILIDKVFKSL